MNENTKINITDPGFRIKLKDNIFTVGSCFSNETTKYFNETGIYSLSNPFGTIYNAHSIYKVFEKIFDQYQYGNKDLYNENSIFFSLEHSTKYDSGDLNTALNKINENIRSSYDQNT